VFLGRQFNKILKQVNRRSKGNGQNIRFNIDKQQSNAKNDELMKRTINTKVSNVMNVKGMDTLELNASLSSRSKRKG